MLKRVGVLHDRTHDAGLLFLRHRCDREKQAIHYIGVDFPSDTGQAPLVDNPVLENCRALERSVLSYAR